MIWHTSSIMQYHILTRISKYDTYVIWGEQIWPQQMYVYIMHCDMQSELMRYMPPSTYRTPERQHPKGNMWKITRKTCLCSRLSKDVISDNLAGLQDEKAFLWDDHHDNFSKVAACSDVNKSTSLHLKHDDPLKNPTMEPTQSTNQSHLHLPFVLASNIAEVKPRGPRRSKFREMRTISKRSVYLNKYTYIFSNII